MLTGNQYVEDLSTLSQKQFKTPNGWQNYLVYQPEIGTAILKVPEPDSQEVTTINGIERRNLNVTKCKFK